MIEPAPQVEAAVASAVRSSSAPDVAPVTGDEQVSAAAAPAVGPATAAPAVAAPGGEAGAGTPAPAPAPPDPAGVAFAASAAVIVGPVEKDLCQRLCPCLDERSFVSYGEAKRYVAVRPADGAIHVFTERTDRTPLYAVPLGGLVPAAEDTDRPDRYSHTISPEANTGFRSHANAARSKASLDTVLLKDGRGNIAYQFTFHKEEAGVDAAEKFMAAVMSAVE